MGDEKTKAAWRLYAQLDRVIHGNTMEARLREWSKLLDMELTDGQLLTSIDRDKYLVRKRSILNAWLDMAASDDEKQQVQLAIKYRSGLTPVYEDPKVEVKPDGTITTGALILNPKTPQDYVYNEAVRLGYKSIEEMVKANEEWMKKYGFDECAKLTDPFAQALCGFQKGFGFIPKAVIQAGGETARTAVEETGKTARTAIDETGKTLDKAGETFLGSTTMLMIGAVALLVLMRK